MFQGMTIGEQRTLLGLAMVIAIGLGVQRYRDHRQNPPLVINSDKAVVASAQATPPPAVFSTHETGAAAPAPSIEPPEPEIVAVPIPSPAPGPSSGKLNLNQATLQDLDTLPNIGPKRAQAMLDYRTRSGGFRSVEDLLAIDGIGEKTLETLRPLVDVK